MNGDSPADDDPRLDGDHVRTVGRVTLVGAVHEHPASVYRAATVVERSDPAVLGLELPPVALPLFSAYAGDDGEPPALGGEMSAAIQAAETDRIVGIDGPSLGFLRRLALTLARERPGVDACKGVCRGLAAVTKEALACAVAGVVASRTTLDLAVGRPVDHACTRHDEPATQSADETRQIRRARAVMEMSTPSRAARFRDEIREAHMAERLDSLGREGDIVAVVGYGHLDSLVSHLESRRTT